MGAAMTRGVVPRVYLDANVFIAAFEHAGASSDHAWWLIRAIEDGEIFAATSELTLAEILVKPLERGQADLADGYGKMMVSGSHFEVMPVRRDILIEAASIRARRSAIRLPDALHIATAKALACGFFISNDRRLALAEGMRLLAVNPFTLDDILRGKP
jgi:predicted nucleic acid-binding protein